VIAIVGVDGSGKTTVAAAVRAWLGSEVDVVPIYFGTGDGKPSALLRPFKFVVPLARRILRHKPKGASHGNVSDRPPGLLYGLLMTVWATVVAREKRNKLLAARRGAQRGVVIITDRYPQNEINTFNDGPLLARLSRVPRWLRRFEAAVYALAQRLPPDLVIKLEVLTETAARREPDMHPAIIRERIADLQRLTFAGACIVRVDAEQALCDVIRAVKREIWRLL
jgi:thymidylate kinase